MKFIELFAGIGGFRKGLGDRFTCVWANELDRYACQIYRRNYGDKELYEGDITKVKAADIPDHDLLCAGFPCQSFSIAGKRRGFLDHRGTMFFEIERIVREKQPRLLLLENVKGLLSHQKGATFTTILSTLDEIGYDCQWQVLNSKNFGVPQNRERVFIVGHLRGTRRPEVFPITSTMQEDNEKLERVTTGTVKQGWGSIQNDATYLRELTTGQSQGMRVYSDNRAEKRQNGRRFKDNGEPMFTLTGQDIHGVSNGYNIRRLTPTECERLQGFDKIEKYVIIEVCLDHQKKNVNAEKKNHKLLLPVLNVGKINLKEIVLSVENNLDIKHPLINKHAQRNVHIDLEENSIKIYNQEKLLLDVSNAEKKNQFHQHIRIEDFALLNVGLYSILEKIIASGRGELHQNEHLLIHQKNGKKLVKLCGKEIMLPAEFVEKDLTILKKLLKSIMSNLSDTKDLEQKLTTLSSFVIPAIIGYIPKETLNQDTFTIILNSKLGWTFGVSDSQRYRQLGNAVTTTVIQAIGERLL